jgi:hypothetical protein
VMMHINDVQVLYCIIDLRVGVHAPHTAWQS